MMSKIELIGPKESIKPLSVFPDHSRGVSVSSASTLSHGSTMQSVS